MNWQIPENATALAGLLGLTGWFLDLIVGYAKKEQPLWDLLKGIELPDNYTKTIYQHIMTNHKPGDKWNSSHTKAFMNLKAEMTSEPVLCGPKWNRTPFIITTDGSQDVFRAVLTQNFEYELPSGRVVQRHHLLGFASK